MQEFSKHLRRTLCLLAAASGVATLASVANARGAPTGVAVLDRYAGRWVSDGNFLRTPYSKIAHVSGSTTCGWSPMRNSLVCDQTVHSGTTDQRDTALYAYDDAAKQYRFAEFPFDGSPPHITELIIAGDTWSYVGGFADGKTNVVFRTTDVFSGDAESWRVEFSLDGGKKWITMGTGTAKKVGN